MTRRQRTWYFDLLNRVGGGGAARALRRPLDAGRLIAQARRKTRLDDFGGDEFREPLCRLLEALEREARLSFIGRIATRTLLLDLLGNRLRIAADARTHPEIARQEIRQPIFIVGLPRSGTTLLHALLAEDRANRTPATWEVMFPSPPPERRRYETDARIAAAERRLRWAPRLSPDLRATHPVGARLPQECILMTAPAFRSHLFLFSYRIPSYESWLDAADRRPEYRYHRGFLQQLQWRAPAERWILKASSHMCALDALLDVYPDARFVQMHRDPLAVTASIASYTAAVRRGFSDEVDEIEVARGCLDFWARALECALRMRDEGCMSEDRVLDLQYRELVADPISAVRRIYDRFAMQWTAETETRMRAFLRLHPKDRHGPHRYSLDRFRLAPDIEARRFAGYRERFGVEREPQAGSGA